MPEPRHERPKYKKHQARCLLRQAALVAVASTHDDGQRRKMERMKADAEHLLEERRKQLNDLERVGSRPAAKYTQSARGAKPDEPLPMFARAMRRTMMELGVSRELADRMVDSGAGEQGKGKGKGQKGGTT